MSFQVNKIRRLWFPFSILAIIVLIAGWILAGVVYPNYLRSNNPVAAASSTPTITFSPTVIPTSTSTPVPTITPTIILPTETPSINCTYPQIYWASDSDAWRIENIILGNLSLSKAEAIEILNLTEPTPTERLMGQFFTTLLNTQNGADSTVIDQTMVTVRDWLILNPYGIDLSASELLQIEAYTELLQEYNLGISGPGLCADVVETPTPAASETPTATATSIPAAVIPAPSPTPTKGTGGRQKPSNTPAQTNTLQPKPSNTPAPIPTTVPPPTDIPTSPPPTDAPTKPPPTVVPTQPPPALTQKPTNTSPPPTSGP